MLNSDHDRHQRKQRWPQVKEIFDAVYDLPQEDRIRYLAERCPSPEVRREVEHLLGHSDRAGSFLESPAWNSSAVPRFNTLQEHDLLADRFEITAFLGAGGMGEVYAAFDRDLNDTVALKVVSSEMVADSRMLPRLRQEIQLARKIAHPNVCRMFDLGKTTLAGREVLFVTMEYLSGENLAALLTRQTSLSAQESLPIAQDIVAGLSAAHQAGILHRDLKPSNVMLAEETPASRRAVITDFGLAKAFRDTAPKPLLTSGGQIMGTPNYMAPEMAAGVPPSVASDIYALGILLLEMRTGHTAFVAGLLLEPGWRSVIARCIAPDPADRFPSAVEVGLALGKAMRPARLSRRIFMGAAAFSTIAVSLSLYEIRLAKRGPHVPQGAQILITPTANFTGDQSLDGLSAVIRSQVSQSLVLNLWPIERLAPVLTSMGHNPTIPLQPSGWREVAMRENVPLVAFSNLTRLGETYNLAMRVEETGSTPQNPVAHWETVTQSAGPAKIFDAVREATLWLRGIVGESAAQISLHDQLPQDTTTPSWEALSLYNRAEQAKLRDNSETAVLLLKDAIDKDPDFALAHARMGDLLMSLGRQREGLAEWQTAITDSARRHLTFREEMRIRSVYGLDSGDLQSSEAALLLWSQDYPHDYLPFFYRGYVYRMQARLAESLQMLEIAGQLLPNGQLIPTSMARSCLVAGDFAGVLRAVKRLRELKQPEAADKFEGAAHMMRGEIEQALALFGRMARSSALPHASAGLLLSARAQAEAGRASEAIDALNRAIQIDTNINASSAKAFKLVSLAFLQQDAPAKARALLLQAFSVYEGPETAVEGGTLLARLGYITDCSQLLDRLVFTLPKSAPASDVIRLRLSGELKLASGKIAAAIEDFEKAASLQPPIVSRDYLARALAAVGDNERARLIYKEILDRPGVPWQDFDTALPGAWLALRRAYDTLTITNPSTNQGDR